MKRKQWFNLGVTLIVLLALGGLALVARQARAQKNTPQEPAASGAARFKMATSFTCHWW